MLSTKFTGWRRPETLLMLMAFAGPLSFAMWMTLINNFAVERAGFTGFEKGLQESIREVPGFLSFTVVFLLLFIREQRLAFVALAILGFGTAITGFLPSAGGIYLTTLIMSVGFHYGETAQQSLALQWIEKERAPAVLGKIVACGSIGAAMVYAGVFFLADLFSIDYLGLYLIGGGATMAIALFCAFAFPIYPQKVAQNTHLVLRWRYWLYYALTFMSGARRQIFIVFAAFMMVDKFGLQVHEIAGLLLANQLLSTWLAPKVGRLIGTWGERRALTLEYLGLIAIFSAYAFCDSVWLAVGLYMLDHVFFALAIAIRTYFQKIADPADIAPTSGVSFTISHIAAVVIPVALGPVYDWKMGAVFLIGAGMAAASLSLALLVPRRPTPGQETVLTRAPAVRAPAE